MELVGIARLASQSELLEAKREVQYFELPARSILNRTKPNMPFQWTINPYRGCEFGCKYCYARYTHEFMEMAPEDFEDKIYAKAAARHLLRQELGRIDRKDGIAIGTATDPYQPAERRYGRTRAILEVFARERGRRLAITTKSDLVARDVDLLREIARANILGVNMTVTTLDEKLARALEPRAPRPELRLQAVRRLRAAGICVAVFPNPIMPGLTDSEKVARRPGPRCPRCRSDDLRRRSALPDALGAGRDDAVSGTRVSRSARSVISSSSPPARISASPTKTPWRRASSECASATDWPPG